MAFYLNLVQKADIIVFMTTVEGFIGKGVFEEVHYAQSLQKDVFFYKHQNQQFYRRFNISDINENNWHNYAQVNSIRN